MKDRLSKEIAENKADVVGFAHAAIRDDRIVLKLLESYKDFSTHSHISLAKCVSRIVEMSDRIFTIRGTNRRYKDRDTKMKIIKNK